MGGGREKTGKPIFLSPLSLSLFHSLYIQGVYIYTYVSVCVCVFVRPYIYTHIYIDRHVESLYV